MSGDSTAETANRTSTQTAGSAGSAGGTDPPRSNVVAETVENCQVIVCCGAGGVGKTTIAAATALLAAAAGKRAVVVTIDPARRLADALGIGELSNTPTAIEGPWPGSLHALMLDTKSTFDEVVRRHARHEAQAQRIIANSFYRNVSATLTGTQDYMAVEKLNELHDSGAYDLVVVDTPPTRDALAFLEAPRMLSRLLANPLYQLVTAPGRGPLKPVNRAARSMLRRLARVVGADVVDEAIAFFGAFEGMQDGFRERAEETLALLSGERTAFVLIASPRGDTIDEARYFLARIAAAGLDTSVVVVNRMLPAPATTLARSGELAAALQGSEAGPAARALADMCAEAAADGDRIGELLAAAPAAGVVEVPLLAGDVCDLHGLAAIAEFL